VFAKYFKLQSRDAVCPQHVRLAAYVTVQIRWCGVEYVAGSSPGAQQPASTGHITCTSSSSSEMAQLDDVCLSPGWAHIYSSRRHRSLSMYTRIYSLKWFMTLLFLLLKKLESHGHTVVL